MVHINGTGCPNFEAIRDEWKEGDEIIAIESAVDPQLLRVDCARCLAIANKELREG